ncbi:hypothetical protein ACHAXS_012749 [Conticribra weissflogii]
MVPSPERCIPLRAKAIIMPANTNHRILAASAAGAAMALLSASHAAAFQLPQFSRPSSALQLRRPPIHNPAKPLWIFGATMDRDRVSGSDDSSSSSSSSTLEGAEWFVKKAKDTSSTVADIEAKREAFQRSLLAARIANDFKSGHPNPSVSDEPTARAHEPTAAAAAPFAALAVKLAKEIVFPLLDPTIAKNVPPKIIRGAAIHGSFLTVLAAVVVCGGLAFPLFETLVAAASVGLFAAYVAITEGKAGEALRAVGGYTWRVADLASEKYREAEAGWKVERAARAMETIGKVIPATEEAVEAEEGVVVENVLREAKLAIRQAEEAKRALRDASVQKTKALVQASEKIDDVRKTKAELARRKREEEMAARRAEEELARKELEVRMAAEAEQRRLEELQRLREKEWLEEQNRLAEERRIARVEEEKRLIEEMRLAEQARIAEEMRLAEEAMAEAERKKEEEAKRKEEELRLAEEARIAAEKAEAERVMKEERERMEAEARARAEEEARLRKLEEEKKKAAEEEEAARLAEFERLAEEARIKEEAEQRRLEEVARMKKEEEEEQQRRLEEMARIKQEEEEELRRLEEMARIKQEEEEEEQRRLEEEEEEQRRLEEVAAAAREAVHLAEAEAALMEEEDDDDDADFIDDDDWEASVRLANELVGMPSSSLGDFSKDADDDMDDLLQMELNELSQEEEDALGKAAREAVRKYEEEMRLARKEKDAIRSSWDEEMVVAPVKDFDDMEDEEDDTAQDEDVDYSSMTVAELKDILRSKGLKVSGKKSELIERLNSS